MELKTGHRAKAQLLNLTLIWSSRDGRGKRLGRSRSSVARAEYPSNSGRLAQKRPIKISVCRSINFSIDMRNSNSGIALRQNNADQIFCDIRKPLCCKGMSQCRSFEGNRVCKRVARGRRNSVRRDA
jgi:hypothetical protein